MKRAVVLLALGLMALSLLAAAGCGEKKAATTTEEKVTVSEDKDGGEVTPNSEKGETNEEWADKPPTEEQLGLPTYPGAEYMKRSGGVAFSQEDGKIRSAVADFTTSDPFDNVVSWYQARLGAPTLLLASGAQWTIGVDEEYIRTVILNVEGGKTRISLARTMNISN
jgi:hypothetical protein